MFVSFGFIITFLSSKYIHLRSMAEEQFATMSGFTINCTSFLKSLNDPGTYKVPLVYQIGTSLK